MDPADVQQLRTAVEKQGALLGTHQQEIGQVNQNFLLMFEKFNTLTGQVQQLLSNPPQPSPPAPNLVPQPLSPFREPRLPAPQSYDGAPGTCRSFISQCSLSLELQPLSFPTERSRVAYLITLLTGRAREWGTALWDVESPCCSSYREFTEEMRRIFDRSFSGREAAREIMGLRQGSRSVFDYGIEFRTLAASCGWNEEALFDAFLMGLSDPIKDELASRELPPDLSSLMDLTGRIDRRLGQRALEKTRSNHRLSVTPPSPITAPSPEPMQIDRARITPEERQRRRVTNSCFYCGKVGHFSLACPGKVTTHQ